MTPSLKAWRACEEHFQREFRERLVQELANPVMTMLIGKRAVKLVAKHILGFHLSWSDAKALEVIASFSEDVPD